MISFNIKCNHICTSYQDLKDRHVITGLVIMQPKLRIYVKTTLIIILCSSWRLLWPWQRLPWLSSRLPSWQQPPPSAS